MKALVSLFLAALLAGCTSVTTLTAPHVDFAKYQHIFVKQPLNENHHLDEMLANELKSIGRDANSGPMTMMPDNTDAVLDYNARWTGDFSPYIIDFSIALRTAHTNKLLAEARYYQPSAWTRPPDVLVRTLIRRMLGTGGGK